MATDRLPGVTQWYEEWTRAMHTHFLADVLLRYAVGAHLLEQLARLPHHRLAHLPPAPVQDAGEAATWGAIQ